MKQRARIQRLKVRILRHYYWWVPYRDLLNEAVHRGYVLQCEQYRRRHRWWVAAYGPFTKPIYTRIYTCGSLRTALGVLKLAMGEGDEE